MKSLFKIGEKYCIQFHDHCIGEFKVVCEITIYVTKEDETHVHGTWWRVITDNHEVEESNREMVSVIKSTIIKKRKQASL